MKKKKIDGHPLLAPDSFCFSVVGVLLVTCLKIIQSFFAEKESDPTIFSGVSFSLFSFSFLFFKFWGHDPGSLEVKNLERELELHISVELLGSLLSSYSLKLQTYLKKTNLFIFHLFFLSTVIITSRQPSSLHTLSDIIVVIIICKKANEIKAGSFNLVTVFF